MLLYTIRYVGTKELLMHNERLANPLDPITQSMKGMTAKKQKTDADFKEIAECEFRGGLYHDETIGVYVPDGWITGSLVAAGKKIRKKDVVRENILVLDQRMPLRYSDEKFLPKSVAGLWQKKFYDQRMVGNQGKRVLRTRPKFPLGWSIIARVQFDETGLDKRIFEGLLKRTQTMGLGDYRPTYGTFEVEVLSAVSIDVDGREKEAA